MASTNKFNIFSSWFDFNTIGIISICILMIGVIYWVVVDHNVEKAPETKLDTLPDHFCVREFDVNGEKHEYLYGWGAYQSRCITHLPNCSYCKDKMDMK